MAYTPDPNDATNPVITIDPSTAAAEFRALKTKINLFADLNGNLKTGLVTATGGTASRSLANRAADFFTPFDVGAAGNGGTDDTTPLAATTSPKFLVRSAFAVAAAGASAAAGRYYSHNSGHLVTSEGKQSNNLSVITAAPTQTGSTGYIFTAMNADYSNIHLPMQTFVKGATTLGQPTVGYQVNPLVSSVYGLYLIDSTTGWNQNTSTDVGRTQAAQITLQVTHNGQGDGAVMNLSANTGGSVLSGLTDISVGKDAILINGGLGASVNDSGLVGIGDIDFNDNGYRTNAFGMSLVFNRTNVDQTHNPWWMGYRVSSIGSGAIDAAFQGYGPMQMGLDLTPATLKTPAGASVKTAIVLKAGQAIYGNGTNSSGSGFPNYTSAGTEYLDYEFATGWQMVVGGTSVFQAKSTGVAINGSVTGTVPAAVAITTTTGIFNYSCTARGCIMVGGAGSIAYIAITRNSVTIPCGTNLGAYPVAPGDTFTISTSGTLPTLNFMPF